MTPKTASPESFQPISIATGARQPRLHRISFTGGLLDGQSFPLSDQLTCLIGSRGSGKSSVIECLRYALEVEPGESDLKYKNGLVSGMLTNGGEVSVTGGAKITGHP